METKNDLHRKRCRDYYQKNKEQHRVSQRKWNLKNKERLSLYKKKWILENPEKRQTTLRKYRLKRKASALGGYGKECACCGEKNIGFLSLDHIEGNGSGSAHRKVVPSTKIYQWVIDNKFPSGFQVLCFNCNQGRAKRGNVCPHKEDDLSIDDVMKMLP